MKNPIVDLKNININHDEKNILSDISLSVRKGEFIYLIGKTGSGKSSLLKILYGDIKILDGEGSVAGINIVILPRPGGIAPDWLLPWGEGFTILNPIFLEVRFITKQLELEEMILFY